jgi:hypothetical protein
LRHSLLRDDKIFLSFLKSQSEFDEYRENHKIKKFNLAEWDAKKIREAYDYAVAYLWNKYFIGVPDEVSFYILLMNLGLKFQGSGRGDAGYQRKVR